MAKTITVGCKLPNGLIITVGEKSIKLNGFARGANIIGGYGMTDNVDEALFDQWMKDHSEITLVKKELIFKATSLKNGEAQAKDTAEKKSGLERIDTKKIKDENPDIEKLKPEN